MVVSLELLPHPVLRYVRSVELMRLALTSKTMFDNLSNAGQLWKTVLVNDPGTQLSKSIAAELGLGDTAADDSYRMTFIIWRAHREAHDAYLFKKVRWFAPCLWGDTEMLGHGQESLSAATLWGGDAVVAVRGWSSLNKIGNEVVLFDTTELPMSVGHWQAQSFGQIPPEPVYGHSVAAVSDDTIALYGGMRRAAYKGAVNSMYLLKVWEEELGGEHGQDGVGKAAEAAAEWKG
ncbi:unnamed protein product, partial [Discosporangium mesarthrocarpum]